MDCACTGRRFGTRPLASTRSIPPVGVDIDMDSTVSSPYSSQFPANAAKRVATESEKERYPTRKARPQDRERSDERGEKPHFSAAGFWEVSHLAPTGLWLSPFTPPKANSSSSSDLRRVVVLPRVMKRLVWGGWVPRYKVRRPSIDRLGRGGASQGFVSTSPKISSRYFCFFMKNEQIRQESTDD